RPVDRPRSRVRVLRVRGRDRHVRALAAVRARVRRRDPGPLPVTASLHHSAMTAMTFRDHFSRQASTYARYRPQYPAAVADLLRSLTTGDTAWDIGCGNGQLTGALAERFARVIATDPSEAQLA